MSNPTPNHFLRTILWVDSSVSLAAGVLHFFGASVLQNMTGIASALYTSTGLFLLVFGVIVGWLAKQPHPPTPMVWTLILGNVGWALASVAQLTQAPGAYSATGNAYLIFNALWVVLMASLEYAGLKKRDLRVS